jgi:propanol-preferring alcohol dehydrogenase
MPATYKAVEISSPNKFSLVNRSLLEPGAGQVRVRVEACGVCHTDAATVKGTYPGLVLPRVPGMRLLAVSTR